MACSHGIPDDFSFIREDGKRVWTCSNCRRTFLWDSGSSYFGSIECTRGGGGYTRGCGWPAIDNVACSETCREALNATMNT